MKEPPVERSEVSFFMSNWQEELNELESLEYGLDSASHG